MSLRLNKTQIQFIAAFVMTLDHIAWVLAPGYSYQWWALLFHMAGRIAAPVMWFFIAQGYEKTKDLKGYAARLLAFALISHFAYCIFTGNSFIPFADSFFEQTSIIWPLFSGLLGIYIAECEALKKWQKAFLILILCALTFSADWSCTSVCAIVWIHINKGSFKKQVIGTGVIAAISGIVIFIMADKVYGLLQLCTILAFPLIKAYNGKKGNMPLGRYFLYIYYPAHLVLLGILRLLVFP